jgi:glycosyltransferase involved in cell wall biosynthesis
MGRSLGKGMVEGDFVPTLKGSGSGRLDPSASAIRRSMAAGRGHVAIVLPGLSAGGTEHVVNIISNHWVDRGHDVTLVTLEPQSAVPYYVFDQRVRIINLNLSPRQVSAPYATWLAFRRVLALRRVLKNIAPDVIISFLMRTNILVLLAMIGSRTPVVVSERNNPALQPLGIAWRNLRSVLYPRAFGLVTMTKGAMGYFPPAMRRRGWIIPNAVKLPEGRRKPGRGMRLAAVGRLVPQKGFDLLIDAFAAIADRHPEWTLTIWGEGPDRKALEKRRAVRGLEGRIYMPGVSDRPGSWLESSDAFVLSSRFEGWGIVLLEAMAWGLPCVSFDCEWGPGEMIANGVDGILVPSGDVAALANEISRVMGDRALRQRLSKAAKASTRRFSRTRVMAAWDEVVDAALIPRNEVSGIAP